MLRKLFSGGSLGLVALLLIAVISLSQILFKGVRLDLTENRLYTLSEGTRSVLAKIEEPLKLHFFYNRDAAQGLPQIQTYAQRVREFLEELTLASDGGLELVVIEPEAFSDDEDRAVELGVRAVPLGDGSQSLYFGLAVSNAVDEVETIGFFQPGREELLEYEIVKLIYQLSTPIKPKLGVMSSLKVNGSFNPQTMQPGQPWVAVQQLEQFFRIEHLPISTTTELPDDLSLLMLVHPVGMDESLLYAIDQFVLRGGNALVFVDPMAESVGARPMGPDNDAPPPNSNLEPLFAGWGIKLSNDILGDAQAALPVQTAAGQRAVYHLAMLGLDQGNMSATDVITRDIESINVGIAGMLQPVEGATTRFEPLLQSGTQAAPIPAFRLQPGMNPSTLQNGFAPTGERYAVAARITGPVSSAYGDTPPAEGDSDGHLAKSTSDINVIVVADTDMLTDRFWVRVNNFLGQMVASPFAGNGDFLINAVDNLMGSSDVISIKSRAGYSRPFERVEQMRRDADASFRSKEEELQQRLGETERKLADLQARKNDENVLMLSPEQQAEVRSFQDEQLRIRKELREVRHSLNKDIESLGAQLKFVNIALVPLLIIIFALGRSLLRRRRMGVSS